jgi:hypothetical protein
MVIQFRACGAYRLLASFNTNKRAQSIEKKTKHQN